MARSSKASSTRETGSTGQRNTTATQLLRKDHETVKQLFHRYEKAGDRAHETKQKLVAEIEREFEAHTTIEEEIFYPAVQDEVPGAKDIVQEAYEEHNVAKSLLRELGAMSAEDEQYDAKVKVLQENIAHHIEEEEGEMFPKAEQLTSERLKDLGAEIQARKEALGQPALKRIMNGVSGLIFGNGESASASEEDEEEKSDAATSDGRSSGTQARSGGRSAGKSRQGQSRQSRRGKAAQGQSASASTRKRQSGGGRSAAKSTSRARTAKKTTGGRAGAQKRGTVTAKKRASGRSAEARSGAQRRTSAKKQRTANGSGASGRRRTTARKTAKKR